MQGSHGLNVTDEGGGFGLAVKQPGQARGSPLATGETSVPDKDSFPAPSRTTNWLERNVKHLKVAAIFGACLARYKYGLKSMQISSEIRAWGV